MFFLLACAGFAALAARHALWPRGRWQGLPAALIVWSAIFALRGLRLSRAELRGMATSVAGVAIRLLGERPLMRTVKERFALARN